MATDGYYQYDVVNNEAIITSYTDWLGTSPVSIPSTLGGYPVTGIGAQAFWNRKLTGISMPDSVTALGDEAFSQCSNLATVVFSSNLIDIGSECFYNCNQITSLSLPNGIETIGDKAFFSCYGLTGVSIPEGVVSIGIQAFWYCLNLASVTLPSTLEVIDGTSFSYCPSLTSITVDEDNAYFSHDSYALYDKNKNRIVKYCEGLTNTSFSIPNTVENIGDSAFRLSKNLVEVEIPQGVTTIGAYGFYGSTIESVEIPSTVNSIGSTAFFNCSFLESITFKSATTTIYDDQYTIQNAATIYGYDPSTAKDYADNYSRTFTEIANTLIEVWTAADLYNVRNNLTADYIQMADIDLSGYSNWEPIGSSSVEFSGIYDGNGHEVNGLTINRTGTSHSGLFGHLKNATVKNLGVININMSGQSYVGGLAGYISHGSKISNCYVTGEIAGSHLVGGLVGDSYINCAISDCYSMCKVSGSSIWIGGLIGRNNSDSSTRLSTVIRCYSINLVTGYNSVGGLVGASDLRLSEVTSSYYDSELSGCSDTGKGVPKTTAEMKQQSTYEGWDFDTVWGIDPAKNDGYPYLRVFDKQEGISLNISIEGNGVTTPSAGTSYYEEGTKVLLTANPGEGNKFIRWEGEGIEDFGGRVTRITMNGNKTVKAVFGEAVTFNLIAAGGGTTIPAPGKLTFAKGDVISLKGVPHKGFKFKEWMGDIIHTHDVQQFIIYDDMMVRAVFEEADEERRSPKRLYFATVKEKAFWRVDGKWRFFATPVHGNLKNLSADDHKQYLTAERHDNTGRHTLGEVIPHDSHMNLLDRGIFTHLQIDNHLENLSNPHKVTAEQIGGASYESGPALPEPSEDYKGCFFSLIGDGVDEKLYYCRLKSDGETYEWKEIF